MLKKKNPMETLQESLEKYSFHKDKKEEILRRMKNSMDRIYDIVETLLGTLGETNTVESLDEETTNVRLLLRLIAEELGYKL